MKKNIFNILFLFAVISLFNPEKAYAGEDDFSADFTMETPTGLKAPNYIETDEVTEDDIILDIDEMYEEYEAETATNPELSVEDFFDSYIEKVNEENLNSSAEEAVTEEDAETEDTEEEEEPLILASAIYNHEWDRYAANYVYNQLSNKQKLFWNSLDSLALSALTNTRNYDETLGYVNYSGRDGIDMLYIFMLEHPQYYFVSNWFYSSGSSYASGIYPEFRNGSKRSEATAQFSNAVEGFKEEIEEIITPGYSSDFEIVKAVNDVICNNVNYISNDLDQSAYSTFVLNQTVCAGYSEGTCLLCNYYDVDCFVVTSESHAWNQVCIEDIWYNTDTTWNDQRYTISYSCFLKSDVDIEIYPHDTSHLLEPRWVNNGNKLSAECNTSSDSSYDSAVNPGTPSEQVQAPEISTSVKSGAIWVSLSCPTEDAVLYYSLDGIPASDGYSRCNKYSGQFKINNLEELANLNVIAVKDGYWDSENVHYPSLFTFSKNKVTGLTDDGRFCDTLEIPAGATSVEPNAFRDEYRILSINIPSSVTSIGTNAFNGCYNLNEITFTDSSKVKSIGAGAFDNIPLTCLIHVKAGSTIEKWLNKNGFLSNICAEYSVVYKLNGGINAVSNPASYISNYSDADFADPERFGYDFNGWYTSSNFKAGTEIETTRGRCAKLTLYAKWTPIPYDITYYNNGATKEAVNPITYNITKAITLKNPTKTGYGFLGWFDNPEFTGKKITQIKKGTTGNIKLYANWEEYSYTLAFNVNGGKGMLNSSVLKYTDVFHLPEDTGTIFRTGYEFLGWSTASNPTKKGAVNYYFDEFGSSCDVSALNSKKNGKTTLYAIWQAIPYSIEYHMKDNEKHVATNNYKNKFVYTVAAAQTLYNPARTGFTFGGWFTKDPDAADFDPKIDKKVTSIKKGSTEGKEFFAKWTVNKYTVIFNANGGKGKMNNLTACEYDKSYTLPQNAFTKTAKDKTYRFKEWNTSAKGTGRSFADEEEVSELVSKNGGSITLYAIWELEQ